jgi:hypothetical protein
MKMLNVMSTLTLYIYIYIYIYGFVLRLFMMPFFVHQVINNVPPSDQFFLAPFVCP